MDRPKIEVKIINSLIGTKIPLPTYTTTGAAGMDVRACLEEAVVIHPGETRLISSGFALNIRDPQLMAVLAPRSGLGIRQGIVLGNLIGVIDSDFHGEIIIGVWHRGDQSFTIEPGTRLCQLLFVPVVQVELTVVTQFQDTTQRGTGGLGHTGHH